MMRLEAQMTKANSKRMLRTGDLNCRFARRLFVVMVETAKSVAPVYHEEQLS
jgi:hypothetical protein